MEIHDPQQAGPFKDDDLVGFVLEANISLRCGEPMILFLQVLHSSVKVVQKFVAQQMVVDQVELSACVMEGAVVALTGEVKPLGMTEFIS